jgi:hypothetical protein
MIVQIPSTPVEDVRNFDSGSSICEHKMDELGHGPLKLRTVHLSDNTIIYENKVSVKNIFPRFKGTIMSRPHTKF